jgi:AcrR family transcriptional regulator
MQAISRRRQETRQRLHEAALRAFADEGFGRATVERICELAGYTRGAFYSNFSSLDELFLAMWEQRSAELVAGLRSALERADSSAANGPMEESLTRILEAVPTDAEWYRISLEFTAHALRNPGLRRAVAAREEAIIEAILPILEALLGRAGLRVRDVDALGHSLVAVHDGTLGQCLLDPDDEAVWRRRRDLFLHVILSYIEENPDE